MSGTKNVISSTDNDRVYPFSLSKLHSPMFHNYSELDATNQHNLNFINKNKLARLDTRVEVEISPRVRLRNINRTNKEILSNSIGKIAQEENSQINHHSSNRDNSTWIRHEYLSDRQKNIDDNVRIIFDANDVTFTGLQPADFTESVFHPSFSDIPLYEDKFVNDHLTFKQSLSFSTASIENENTHLNDDNEVNCLSDLLLSQLKDERYISGELSSVDYRIEGLLRDKGESFVIKLMNKLALKCYSSKNEITYSHYLNVLKNLTFHSRDDSLKTNVLAALGHRSTVIKEAAIAIFEGWNYQSADEARQMIGLLENVDTKHVVWLSEYKDMVIRDLKDEFEVN
ncbi:hypothetical protein [Aeromonas enteropelogenes]|uniref:hypothetical protein n=1 Tax=Aeromonas enteropelogenes TaxID=29489 RepID=UPI0038D15140